MVLLQPHICSSMDEGSKVSCFHLNPVDLIFKFALWDWRHLDRSEQGWSKVGQCAVTALVLPRNLWIAAWVNGIECAENSRQFATNLCSRSFLFFLYSCVSGSL